VPWLNRDSNESSRRLNVAQYVRMPKILVRNGKRTS
jgi:hypothetical protein